MLKEPRPLTGEAPGHVALPRAPLIRVIAQVRFPTILAIGDERRVADFQEKIRKLYPVLEATRAPEIVVAAGGIPNVQERPVWRFADKPSDFGWRVSLSPDFLALETRAYHRGHDFLDRFRTLVVSLVETFEPTTVQRFGMRYIDRVTGEGFARLRELIKAPALGILQNEANGNSRLSEAVVHFLTQAELVAAEGKINARWGAIPAGGTYDPNNVEQIDEPSWVLDLDMFTTETSAFTRDGLMTTASLFRERIYDVFRMMVEDKFLEFYGGQK